MPVSGPIYINDSSNKTITGQLDWDRDNGGVLNAPSGTSFPVSPVAGEWFWRSDTNILYRRNNANSAWESVTAAAGPQPNSILAFGNGGIATNTTARYLTPGFITNNAPTSPVQLVCTRAGTLKNFYVRHNTAGTGASNLTYTVRVNGVASTLTITMLPTATTGSDLVNTVTVVAGDRIDVRVTKAAGISSSPNDIMATFEVAV